jgi:hypothetical protein
MGYDDWYEKTYSTFKVDTFRPKAGISYIPISCKVCEKPFKIKLMSKGREFTIRFALAFFGIVGISIAFMSSIDLGFRYFGGIGGALAFCFSFMQKEQFAIRLVSENPDGKHAIIYKKKF